MQEAILRNMPNPAIPSGLPFFPGMPMYAPLHGAVPSLLPMHTSPLLPPQYPTHEQTAPKSPKQEDEGSNYVQQLQSKYTHFLMSICARVDQ